MQQFKERLKERMVQKNIDTREFAKRLYNYGSTSDLWKGYSKKNTDMRKIQKWIKGDTEPKNIDELKKVCDVLDCDFSYLLGDSTITNLNNKKIAEWLGLDEITVSNIKNYDNSIKYFMSLLVRANEHDNKFGDILLEFLTIMMIHSENSSNKTITIKDNLTGEIDILKGEHATNYIMSTVKNMMEGIFYKVSIIGMDIGKIKRDNKYKEEERQWKEKMENLLNEISEITGKTKEEILKEIE